MGISEFALHNVLRTYSRQERLGHIQKPRQGQTQAASSADQVSLSRGAQKAQWLGQLAMELVDLRQPGLPAEERSNRIRSVKQELVAVHSQEIADDGLSPESFQEKLRPAYLL